MIILDKRQGWQKVLDRFSGAKRSFRLDTGIEGIVLALNAGGVRTTQSCEGHLGHGLPYPWVRVVEADCVALERFLEAFYQKEPAPYDRMLQIEHLLTDEYMLRPHGGVLQKIREHGERARKLAEYQYEMQDFAAFLKRRFECQE